jgi:hypothetical protein
VIFGKHSWKTALAANYLFLFPQTFLEQSKTRFNKNYKGMSLSKITTTVGLNSKGTVRNENLGGPQPCQASAQAPGMAPEWFALFPGELGLRS